MKLRKNFIMISMQLIFLVLVFAGMYLIYPKVNISVNGNFIKFDSINANVIIISKNPDFSNPNYLDLNELGNVSFRLDPGVYYWKSANRLIKGFGNEFVIESEVGLSIDRNNEESELVNIGNVKINVSKNKDGIMVGHIILEPEESKEIDDKNENYIGGEV